jgi:hypothetical protein
MVLEMRWLIAQEMAHCSGDAVAHCSGDSSCFGDVEAFYLEMWWLIGLEMGWLAELKFLVAHDARNVVIFIRDVRAYGSRNLNGQRLLIALQM